LYGQTDVGLNLYLFTDNQYIRWKMNMDMNKSK
jgi:hypothetical protein